MARRGDFKSEETYRAYKRREYTRYYTSTQLYSPRKWQDDEIDFLIKNPDMLAREVSFKLHRSIKSIEHKRGILRKYGRIA